MRRGMLLVLALAVLCLSGCKEQTVSTEPAGEARPSLSEVTVRTDPGGGAISVVELNRVLGDGDSVLLEAGRYTLRAVKAGYKPGDVVVDVDGVAPVSVTMPLGAGFGRVDVSADVAGATVLVDGETLGPAPGVFELPQGAASLVVRAEGYVDSVHSLDIVPGQTVALSAAMSAVPTAGPLTLAASDPKAVVLLDGKKVGTGTVRLAGVPFGKHTAVAVRRMASHVRLYAEGEVLLDTAQGASLAIAMQEQRRFEGRWLPAAQALRREAKRYLAARVENPVAVHCALDAAAAVALRGDAALGQRLHAVMRVGDRVVLAAPGGEWTFWKRGPQVGDEFSATAAAFAEGKPCVLPFAREAASRNPSIESAGEPLAEIAFALHAARSRLPFLDLAGDQLGSSCMVYRSLADGAVSVVALGGGGISVAGHAAAAMGEVTVVHLGPMNAPLSIAWTKKPRRLLVVGDGPSPLSRIPAAGAELRIHEKLIVPFGTDSISHITRLSWLPEDGTWRTQEIEGSTPMGVTIDLGTDEIGPQPKKGQYKRIWLVRYKDGAAETQRQVGTAYTVSDEVKSGRTDRFFRRGGQDEQ